MINEYNNSITKTKHDDDDFVDVDDFEKYKQTTRKDVPKPEKDGVRKT